MLTKSTTSRSRRDVASLAMFSRLEVRVSDAKVTEACAKIITSSVSSSSNTVFLESTLHVTCKSQILIF